MFCLLFSKIKIVDSRQSGPMVLSFHLSQECYFYFFYLKNNKYNIADVSLKTIKIDARPFYLGFDTIKKFYSTLCPTNFLIKSIVQCTLYRQYTAHTAQQVNFIHFTKNNYIMQIYLIVSPTIISKLLGIICKTAMHVMLQSFFKICNVVWNFFHEIY